MPKGHAVIDGSNLATEGRSEPSLAQLDEAVAAFEADHDFSHVTIVVDASFEHRVVAKERTAAKRAIDAGRIITPPAGVVGRGDTFILQIADRAKAVVVSNDSFQEFHGRFDWLFEEGRLIGGKPVEHVGWVFVPRVPVRGPTSRKAVRDARSGDDDSAAAKPKRVTKASVTKKAKTAPKATAEAGTKKANRPAKKATSQKSGTKKATTRKPSTKKAKTQNAGTKKPPAKKTATQKAGTKKAKSGAPSGPNADKGDRVDENPVKSWRRFRHDHPVGSTVEATVERFSSHGAYALTADGLSAYLPSRLLAEPEPNRARDVVAVGEELTLVVHEYDEKRRSIDLGLVPFDAKATKSPAKEAAAKTTTNKTRASKTRASKRSTSRR